MDVADRIQEPTYETGCRCPECMYRHEKDLQKK